VGLTIRVADVCVTARFVNENVCCGKLALSTVMRLLSAILNYQPCKKLSLAISEVMLI
jgi:hypothetical protein